ncbi:putative pre-16S rRNA nuclease [Planctomycetales bacterium]|nr:putative pre-16S rRNA nuclease [Planctomycetales bacterium]GHT03449.1 putative pre-16S rRNA nuclease [Planctomycetales bacterium]
MIYLGVDLGDRRIGFATADDDCLIAMTAGCAAVKNPAQAPQAVGEKYREVGAGLAVVGLPLSMNGRKNEKSRAAEQVAAALRAQGLQVELWDERLTTEEARKTLIAGGVSRKERGGKIDALAAQIILHSYLAAHQAQS